MYKNVLIVFFFPTLIAIFQIMSYSSKAIVSTLFTTVENESTAEKPLFVYLGPEKSTNPKSGLWKFTKSYLFNQMI